MYCPNCGIYNNNNSNHCIRCGCTLSTTQDESLTDGGESLYKAAIAFNILTIGLVVLTFLFFTVFLIGYFADTQYHDYNNHTYSDLSFTIDRWEMGMATLCAGGIALPFGMINVGLGIAQKKSKKLTFSSVISFFFSVIALFCSILAIM